MLNTEDKLLVQDSKKFPEECKDALELSLNNTYHSADCAMANSEETTNMDQVIDTDRDANKENDEEKGRDANFNMISHASEDSKSEKTSDVEIYQDTDRENDGEKRNSSNFNTITHAAEDLKCEKTADLDTDRVIDTNQDTDKDSDGETKKASNFDTITRASKDPKSGETSDFDTDRDKENDEERDKISNFITITHASDDPKDEKISDLDIDQVIDTNGDTNKANDEETTKTSKFNTITRVSKDPTSDFDIDRDKENNEQSEKGSNFDTVTHVSEDPKSENTSDRKSIQHEFPETKAESFVGTKDDGSSQKSKYDLGFSLERIEDNGHVMRTEISTNADCIGAKQDTDVEKKNGYPIESIPCHKCTMPVAENVDTKDEEAATDLIFHNSSGLPPEEILVIGSPKSSMQVPEVRCTVLEEESQSREEHLGAETVVQDSIPTQSKISNGVQEEFNNAVESEVSPESVANNKNQNEATGEDSEDSDGEYLEISEQGMAILTLSIEDCKHKNEEMGEMGEMTEVSTNNGGHEAERREPEESTFEPVLEFQPQIHQKETTITIQTTESTDESISALTQETETAIEKSEKKPSDSLHCIQTASTTSTETKQSTKTIDEQIVTTLPFSTSREQEDQGSPGRTSNESNSDNSIGHIEMRKSPSFNIDIQTDGRTGETEKTPLLYEIKSIEDLPNLQEISFPNPMEKRVVRTERIDSEKSKPSFPGFAKEKEESDMESKTIDQTNLASNKKAAKDFPPPLPIRKGKRRTKSLIFGTCICCATSIN